MDDYVYNDGREWADLDEVKDRPNERAKYLMERTVWGLVSDKQNKDNHPAKLASMLPYFMVGPPAISSAAFCGDYTNSSFSAISQILYNQQPAFPNVSLPVADVRDVAAAHVNAALLPELAGRNDRFLLAAETLWFEEIIKILQEHQEEIFGDASHEKIRTRIVGYFTIKIASSTFYPGLKSLIPFLGSKIQLDGQAAVTDLGVNYRDVRKSIVEMAKEIQKINS